MTMQRTSIFLSLLLSLSLVWGCSSGTGGQDKDASIDLVNDSDLEEKEVSTTDTNNRENRPPIMQPIGDRVLTAGELGVIAIEARDPDNDPLSYFIAGSIPDGAKFNSKRGVFTWEPNRAQVGLEIMLTFGVTDGSHRVSETITITVVQKKVNHKPHFLNPNTLVVKPKTHFEYKLKATDPDGDDLMFSSSGPVPEGLSIQNNGLLTWDVPDKVNEHYRIIVVVSDGDLTDSGEVTLIIQNKKHPPVVEVPDHLVWIPEKENIYQIKANDPDNDPLTFKLTGPQPIPEGLEISKDGKLIWTPPKKWAGLDLQVEGELSDGTFVISFKIPIHIKDIYPPQIMSAGMPDVYGNSADLFFNILDETPIKSASFVYHMDQSGTDKTEDLTYLEGSLYGITLKVDKAMELEYFIEAIDSEDNRARYPEEGYKKVELKPCPKPDHLIFVRVYYNTLSAGDDEKKEEFVWLYNPSKKDVDLTDWAVVDDCGNGKWYFFPDKTVIKSKDYLQMARDKAYYMALFDNQLTPEVTDFNLDLNNKGDCLVLVDTNADIVDQVC